MPVIRRSDEAKSRKGVCIMPPTPMRLAELIADDLFTTGSGKVATRLVLELPRKQDGGGWCRHVFIERVASILAAHSS